MMCSHQRMLSYRSKSVNRLSLFFSLFSLIGASYVDMSSENVRKKFEEFGIVSELIPVPPKHAMEVLYKNNSVKLGNEFKRGDFDTMPTNLQWPTENSRYYTVIFTDPDCPKRSSIIENEWQHWVVVNIPECDFLEGEDLSPYIGGLSSYLKYPHRYVFLTYLQPDGTPIKFDEPRLDHRPMEIDRNHFSTKNFVEKYNLGFPVAGNFFMAGGPELKPNVVILLSPYSHMNFSDFHGLFFTTITLCCFIKGSSAEVKMGPLRKRNILKKSGIVPDVIDMSPKNILQIVYENQKEVAMGNNLSRWDTIEDPVEISYPAEQDSYYTIIMTDLDCPSRENPIHREWQHWVLVNIPGAEWTQGFYLTDYIGILGEYEHAVHRYVFLLYKQPGQLNFTERVLDARPIELLRYKFSTRKFAEKYKLGTPLAANFFKSGEATKRVSKHKSTKVKTTVTKLEVEITTPTPRSSTATEIVAVERKMTTTTLASTATSAKTSTKTRRKMKMTDVATTISVIPKTDQASSIGTTVTQKTWSTAFPAAVVPPEPLIQYEDIPDVVPDVWLPNILTECPLHIVKEMKQLKIIPDLVTKPPPFGIQIEWENAEAVFGNILQPDEIPEEPIEIFWHADKGKIHTLMLLDLDAPCPRSPRFREYLHWLVVNIPDHHFLDGECVASYLPPDTRDDPHRLAFLVFEQPTCTYIDIEKLKNYTELGDTAREKFSWRKFADKWELGSPLAINYFYIEKYGPSDPRARVNPPDTDEEGGWFNF